MSESLCAAAHVHGKGKGRGERAGAASPTDEAMRVTAEEAEGLRRER